MAAGRTLTVLEDVLMALQAASHHGRGEPLYVASRTDGTVEKIPHHTAACSVTEYSCELLAAISAPLPPGHRRMRHHVGDGCMGLSKETWTEDSVQTGGGRNLR